MKRVLTRILCVFLALFLSPVLFANAKSDKSSLKDITKPYVGTYECEELTLGGKDETQTFEYFRIELTLGGEVKVSTKDNLGHKRSGKGRYTYDKENGKFYITRLKYFGSKKIPFEFLNGEMYIHTKLGPKMLTMRLKRK